MRALELSQSTLAHSRTLASPFAVLSATGTQEPSWSALGWSAYRGAADYDAGAL